MTIREEIVHAVFKDHECRKCHKGFYRFDSFNDIEHPNEFRFKHVCSECGDVMNDNVPWPHLRYRNKNFFLQQVNEHPDDGNVVPLDFSAYKLGSG